MLRTFLVVISEMEFGALLMRPEGQFQKTATLVDELYGHSERS